MYGGNLCYVSEFVTQGAELHIILSRSDDDGDRGVVEPYDPEKLEVIRPASGLINVDLAHQTGVRSARHRASCWRLCTHPRRSPTRSLSQDNVSIQPVIGGLGSASYQREMASLRLPLGKLAIVQNIIDPRYPSYHTALRNCMERKAVAVSPRFFVAASNQERGKRLFGTQFGIVGTADEHSINVGHQGTYQEIQDWVRNTNLDVRVTPYAK